MNPNSNITEEDLIGLQLKELAPSREREVHRALAQDAALAAEYASVAAVFASLHGGPVRVDSAMLERNWNALRPGLIAHVKPMPRMPAWRTAVFAGLALASAATMAYLGVARHLPAQPAQGNATPSPLPPEVAPGLSLSQEPGRGDVPLRMLPGSGYKVRFSGGVYHPPAQHPDSSIRLLGLAHAGALAEPGTALRRDAPASALPLTLEPSPPAQSLAAEVQVAPQGLAQAMPPGAAPAGHGVRSRPRHQTDLMLAVGGNFIAAHSSLTAGTELRTQTATHAIAALAAFHQQFCPALGYRITTSYSRPDFNYTYLYSGGEINSRIYELTGTYVIQGPHHKRLSTSADAGAGLMAFLPTDSNLAASYVYRAAGVLGANVDVALTKHWGARLAYRAQIFKGPDFRYNGGVIPVTTSVTVSNEPSLGITYRFVK